MSTVRDHFTELESLEDFTQCKNTLRKTLLVCMTTGLCERKFEIIVSVSSLYFCEARTTSYDERETQMQTFFTFVGVCCSQLRDDPARNMKHKQNSPTCHVRLPEPNQSRTGTTSLFILMQHLPQPWLPSHPPLISASELLASQIKWKQHAWMSGKQGLWELAARRV